MTVKVQFIPQFQRHTVESGPLSRARLLEAAAIPFDARDEGGVPGTLVMSALGASGERSVEHDGQIHGPSA